MISDQSIERLRRMGAHSIGNQSTVNIFDVVRVPKPRDLAFNLTR
jgi:hypothetical protein